MDHLCTYLLLSFVYKVESVCFLWKEKVSSFFIAEETKTDKQQEKNKRGQKKEERKKSDRAFLCFFVCAWDAKLLATTSPSLYPDWISWTSYCSRSFFPMSEDPNRFFVVELISLLFCTECFVFLHYLNSECCFFFASLQMALSALFFFSGRAKYVRWCLFCLLLSLASFSSLVEKVSVSTFYIRFFCAALTVLPDGLSEAIIGWVCFYYQFAFFLLLFCCCSVQPPSLLFFFTLCCSLCIYAAVLFFFSYIYAFWMLHQVSFLYVCLFCAQCSFLLFTLVFLCLLFFCASLDIRAVRLSHFSSSFDLASVSCATP